jgi:ATP-dependent DNA helicase RecG
LTEHEQIGVHDANPFTSTETAENPGFRIELSTNDATIVSGKRKAKLLSKLLPDYLSNTELKLIPKKNAALFNIHLPKVLMLWRESSIPIVPEELFYIQIQLITQNLIGNTN